jgi:hypothetical protein
MPHVASKPKVLNDQLVARMLTTPGLSKINSTLGQLVVEYRNLASKTGCNSCESEKLHLFGRARRALVALDAENREKVRNLTGLSAGDIIIWEIGHGKRATKTFF